MSNVVLPELGEGITAATVSFWYFKPGDYIAEGEDLVEIATDKATFNVPATVSGKIKEIMISLGQEAKIGQALAVIE